MAPVGRGYGPAATGHAPQNQEADSREWHLSPRDWERTLARDVRMSACGIVVLRISPRRLRAGPGTVAAEIRSALAAGRHRGRLDIRAVPAR